MKKLFLVLILFLIPCLLYAWTDTTGSTFTTTTGDYDVKDIVNASFDRGNMLIVVEISSGMLTGIYETVDTSDTITHDWLDLVYKELFAVARSTWQNRQYDESFAMARSTWQARIYDELYAVSRSTWQNLQYLESFAMARSTWQVETYYELFAVSRSTWQNLQYLEMFSLARSTGINQIIDKLEQTRLDLWGVARSTGTDALIDKVEQTRIGLFGVARSTGIDELIDRIGAVVISSGTIFTKTFKVSSSTGTTLSVGSGASVGYTPQSGVIEIFVEASDDNTDTLRYRYFDQQVATAGNKLQPGDFKAVDTWKGTIYFQSESGTQEVIINELYE